MLRHKHQFLVLISTLADRLGINLSLCLVVCTILIKLPLAFSAGNKLNNDPVAVDRLLIAPSNSILLKASK